LTFIKELIFVINSKLILQIIKMKEKILLLLLPCFLFVENMYAQSVGIGTTTPDPKAILEIKATDKGILFPRLTTGQRNGIQNPPDGLHIFNTDERCLNYYDLTNQVWNCYCFDCQSVIINITINACKVDFYNTYAKWAPSKKYLINIASGVSITGCNTGDTALSFSSMPFNATITINNNGTIAGAGGKGGNGAISRGCYPLEIYYMAAIPGQNAGPAISTKAGVVINVNNYGIVAGGGGGGGGSSGTAANTGYGGGGGGGAGIVGGTIGNGGGFFTSSPIIGCVGAINYQGQNGTAGQSTTAGSGGAGASGGYTGGNGGGRAQAGLDGTVYFGTSPGGAAGKAVIGGSGNSITNITGGQSFGIVD